MFDKEKIKSESRHIDKLFKQVSDDAVERFNARPWEEKLYDKIYNIVWRRYHDLLHLIPDNVRAFFKRWYFYYRIQLSDFNVLGYTYYAGEHTFLFATETECNLAFDYFERNQYILFPIVGWWYVHDTLVKEDKEFNFLGKVYWY